MLWLFVQYNEGIIYLEITFYVYTFQIPLRLF